MFQKAGFEVLLLDEYKTSKICPQEECYGSLETFKKRKNPKPWKNNLMTVHGLLRCKSEICQQACKHEARFWNRDDVATLNMRIIVREFIIGNGRPERFARSLFPE